MNAVRRLVSGKKARYEEDGVSLDLVYLTDRIIIMGYPASGVEALYRNERSQVLNFLTSRHGDKFHLVNLCPRHENSYPPSDFSYRVARFPFEDHLPPPLPLIKIFTTWATRWMNQDPENVLVIHCKAGKGRSGTFAVSYLLTLPGLPSAPALPDGSALDPAAKAPETLPDALTMEEKVDKVLAFHTKRRMAEGTTSRGVSISSQRRWIRYWGRILDGRDPRPAVSPRVEIRKVRLEGVRIYGPGLEGVAGKVGHGKVSAHVLRYKDGVATRLRERELALASEPEGPNIWGDDDQYDDKEDMVVSVGLLSEPSVVQSAGTSTATNLPDADTPDSNVRSLIPAAVYLSPGTETGVKPLTGDEAAQRIQADGGIVLDADREFQLKLLVGRTGSKHAKLHTMLALGVVWAIPSFESTADSGGVCSFRVPAEEVDFLKAAAGVEAVEVLWRWL